MYETLIWVVPAGIAIAGLRWPRGGLLIFAATLPLFGAPPGGPYLAALDVSALAAIATGLRGGAGRRTERRSALDVAVLAVLATTLAAFFPLAYRPPSWTPESLVNLLASLPGVERWTIFYTWRALADLLLGIGLYLAVKRAFDRSSLAALARAFGAGLLGSLVLGFAVLAGWVDVWTFRPIGLPLFDQRFHSIFFHSGWMAEFMILATPFAAVVWARRTSKWRVVGLAMVMLALAAVFFSGQRGAWFTALLQLALAAVLVGRTWRSGQHSLRNGAVAVLATVTVMAGVVLLQPQVGESVQERLGDAVANLSNRTVVWKIATEAASERPMLGWGAGSFSPVFDLEAAAGDVSRVPGQAILGHHHSWLTAHNTYLMFLVEGGGLGLAALLLLGWLSVRVAWRTTQSSDTESRHLAAALLVSATGFAAYGLVQYLFFPRSNALLIWMLLGAVAALDLGARRLKSEKFGWMLVAAALLLLPFRMALVEGTPDRGSRSFGFHAPEPGAGAIYQWTAVRHAERRIAWQDEVLVLRVANGHPKASARPVALEVFVDGAIVQQAVLGEGWWELRVDLGPPRRDTIVLGIRVDRTFRPFSEYRRDADLEDSRDLRRLGVAVGEIAWEKAPETRVIPLQ